MRSPLTPMLTRCTSRPGNTTCPLVISRSTCTASSSFPLLDRPGADTPPPARLRLRCADADALLDKGHDSARRQNLPGDPLKVEDRLLDAGTAQIAHPAVFQIHLDLVAFGKAVDVGHRH